MKLKTGSVTIFLSSNIIVTEYDITSAIKSPNGDEVSVVTTNQTHTAVENLKPESRFAPALTSVLVSDLVPLYIHQNLWFFWF